MPSAATWASLIGLAALGTSLAYIVFFQIMNRSGATNVMLVTLLIPVTAILLGFLVLGEPLTRARNRRRADHRQRAAGDRRAGVGLAAAAGLGRRLTGRAVARNFSPAISLLVKVTLTCARSQE